MQEPVKTVVRIGDHLKITRVEQDEYEKFAINCYDEFDDATHTVEIIEPKDAVAFAKELMAWAENCK